MEEDRATAKKRFDVAAGEIWQVKARVAKKPSFATGPFDEWLQLVASSRKSKLTGVS
jgi:hypothetical protein